MVNPTRAEQLIATLDRVSQYLPWLWLIGAPLTFALLATGLVGGERLRRSAELLTGGPIVDACDALKEKLKITRRVAIAVTDRVAQPVLVGIVRPMILLPWAALHGWGPDEIEMVLVHELAHVRRWDNLVNLGQRVVESLLFYHPAVWLVSRWLRHDREECCDAVVVAQTGEPAEYANLLITVASQLKRRRSLLAASAMAQHPLTRRIRRLLQLEDDPMLVSRTSVLMGVAALVVALVVAANYPLLAEDEPWGGDVNALAPSEADEPDDAPSRPPVGVFVHEIKKAGETVEAGEVIATLSKETSDEAADPNSPFLSLEDQRVADLAYNMLGIEVEPLTEELPPEGRERGFKGGVKVVQFDPHNTRQERNLAFMQGDILVGLHVWPINDFDSLGEVLRRDDLEQYSPLKVYMLRPRAVRRSVRSGRGEESESESESEIGGFELVTGRMSFDTDAWSKEQVRLGNRPEPERRQWGRPPRETQDRDERQERQDRDQSPTTAVPNRNPSEENVSKGGDLSQLRYDGRSFDEWRSLWRNELKVEERIEAIKAMTAFGRAGYGREAAAAIFDVAAQYSVATSDPNARERRLIEVVKSSLEGHNTGQGIAVKIWLPLLKERIGSDTALYRGLASELLPEVWLDEATLPIMEELTQHEDKVVRLAAFRCYFGNAGAEGVQAEVEEMFGRALNHDDVPIVVAALQSIADPEQRGTIGRTWPVFERLHNEVAALLFHPSEEVRKEARYRLSVAVPETAEKIAQKVLEVVKGKAVDGLTPTEAKVAALRALVVLVEPEMTDLNRIITKREGFQIEKDPAACASYYYLWVVSFDPEKTPEKLKELKREIARNLDREGLREFGRLFQNEFDEIVPEGRHNHANIMYVEGGGPDAPFGPNDPFGSGADQTTEIAESPNVAEAAHTTPPDRVRYQGRSFADWRAQWQNELDVDQRTEAIKALSAFARAGFGREAADAILEVAAQYNMAISDGHSAEFQLVQAIKSSLEHRYSSAGIPAEVWMSVLKERLEADPKTFKRLVVAMLPIASLTELTRPIVEEFSRSEDKETRRAAFELYFYHVDSIKNEVDDELRRALAHEDATIVTYAIKSMVRYESVDRGTPPRVIALPIVERLRPEVLETLFHREEAVRQFARWLIASTDDSLARRFAEELATRLAQSSGESPEAADTRIAALRALGALGPRARGAMESLKDPKRLFDGPDIPTRAAFAMALYQILGMKDSGDRDKMGALTPLWESMAEGLNEEENKRLETQFLEEASLVFPRDEVPLSASEVVKYIKEGLEKAIQERERQTPAGPGGSPATSPAPGTLPE